MPPKRKAAPKRPNAEEPEPEQLEPKLFKDDKEVKKEEPEDVKDIPPIVQEEPQASGSACFHIKGEITAEQLVPRHIYECEHCSFTANTDDRITQHRETKHKIFHCRFCKTDYPSKFQQHKHFAKLLAMRQKVKKQCDDIKNKNHKDDCIRCMHTPVKCPICKIIYKTMFELGDYRTHGCKQYAVRLFACSGCKTQFQTANGLKSHLIARSSENNWKCFNTGVLSFESMQIPKYTRRVAHIHHEEGFHPSTSPITTCLVPIKDEPTEPDEMHGDRTKHALVAAHLLSDHNGSMTQEYYYAMRKMFYRIDCPFCGIQCRTFGALHTHGLQHHPPFERCLYQCGGCEQTYQTPTGLGQHLKREFDMSNATCFNTINLVRKQDYLGPVTGWNKTNKINKKHLENSLYTSKVVDVKVEDDFNYEEVVKKEEPDDFGYGLPGTSSSAPDPLFNLLNSSSSIDSKFMKEEIKEEPLD